MPVTILYLNQARFLHETEGPDEPTIHTLFLLLVKRVGLVPATHQPVRYKSPNQLFPSYFYLCGDLTAGQVAGNVSNVEVE